MLNELTDEITLETEYDGDKKSEPIELTELFRRKPRAAPFSEIITVQAIICVITAILFIAANTAFPDNAAEVYDKYSEAASAQDDPMLRAAEAIVDFLNSKPAVYD